MTQHGKDPSGPLVAVCDGQRCRALRRLHDGDGLADLRAAVRRTRGAVLVRCGCLGRCDLGAVVLLGWTGPLGRTPGAPSEPLVLAGMEDAAREAALAAWLPGPGPLRALRGGAALPEDLALARAAAGRGG